MHSHKKFLVTVNRIHKSFNNHAVLEDCSFSIFEGERVGLVGPNGSGKSTLLKIIIGEILPDDGNVDIQKKTVINYLPQIHNEDTLSGGEKAKKVLIPLIQSKASLFLLDEPTNNLDEEGLRIIEDFIINNKHAFLIVSHDREFLDKTVTKIVELDATARIVNIYDGNYSSYNEQRNMRIERQWKEYADKIEKSKQYKSSVNEKIEWKKVIEHKRKTIRNLPIHEREKPVASILRDQEGRMGKRARIIRERMEKYLEDSDSILKPNSLMPLQIKFEEEGRGGTKVFVVNNAEKHYSNNVIGPFSMDIQYGERIHIQGRNGCGKSTLLQMMEGKLSIDKGTIEKGIGVRVGYLKQKRVTENDQSVLQSFMNDTGLEEEDSRRILNRFRITSQDILKEIRQLSPGEYSRMLIATLVAQKPNCIILDEPTNHLDLEVMEEFEKALSDFRGTIIVVSHDRYFVKKIGITRIMRL